jgi:hypothetical protein
MKIGKENKKIPPKLSFCFFHVAGSLQQKKNWKFFS